MIHLGDVEPPGKLNAPEISWVAWLWLATAWMSGEDLTACINSGALLPLATFFLLLVKSDQIGDLGLAAVVVRRFSASSLIAVAAMALTGLSNSVFMVGSVQGLLTTDYGRLLISKIVLFLLLVVP